MKMEAIQLLFEDSFERNEGEKLSSGFIKFEKPVEIHSARIKECRFVNKQEKSLEFFARDIAEKSSRYLLHGTMSEYETGSHAHFASRAPTTQLFLRGDFEFLSLALYGRILHDYVLPKVASAASQAKPKTASDDQSKSQPAQSMQGVGKSASVAGQLTIASNNKAPVQAPQSNTNAIATSSSQQQQSTKSERDIEREQRELRETREREKELREKEREKRRLVEIETLKNLHVRLPPTAFTVYSAIGPAENVDRTEEMNEDKQQEGEPESERNATRPLRSHQFARKGCLASSLELRDSHEKLLVRFLDLCQSLDDAVRDFGASGNEDKTVRERLDATLESLGAKDWSELPESASLEDSVGPLASTLRSLITPSDQEMVPEDQSDRPFTLSTTVRALGAIGSLSRALPLFADIFARHNGLEHVMRLFFYLQDKYEGDVFVRLRVLECLREILSNRLNLQRFITVTDAGESDYQCLVRFLLSPQAGCLVEVIDAILHRVHVYTRVNRFQEKAEYFLVDPGLDVFDDNDAADSIEQLIFSLNEITLLLQQDCEVPVVHLTQNSTFAALPRRVSLGRGLSYESRQVLTHHQFLSLLVMLLSAPTPRRLGFLPALYAAVRRALLLLLSHAQGLLCLAEHPDDTTSLIRLLYLQSPPLPERLAERAIGLGLPTGDIDLEADLNANQLARILAYSVETLRLMDSLAFALEENNRGQQNAPEQTDEADMALDHEATPLLPCEHAANVHTCCLALSSLTFSVPGRDAFLLVGPALGAWDCCLNMLRQYQTQVEDKKDGAEGTVDLVHVLWACSLLALMVAHSRTRELVMRDATALLQCVAFLRGHVLTANAPRDLQDSLYTIEAWTLASSSSLSSHVAIPLPPHSSSTPSHALPSSPNAKSHVTPAPSPSQPTTSSSSTNTPSQADHAGATGEASAKLGSTEAALALLTLFKTRYATSGDDGAQAKKLSLSQSTGLSSSLGLRHALLLPSDAIHVQGAFEAWRVMTRQSTCRSLALSLFAAGFIELAVDMINDCLTAIADPEPEDENDDVDEDKPKPTRSPTDHVTTMRALGLLLAIINLLDTVLQALLSPIQGGFKRVSYLNFSLLTALLSLYSELTNKLVLQHPPSPPSHSPTSGPVPLPCGSMTVTSPKAALMTQITDGVVAIFKQWCSADSGSVLIPKIVKFTVNNTRHLLPGVSLLNRITPSPSALTASSATVLTLGGDSSDESLRLLAHIRRCREKWKRHYAMKSAALDTLVQAMLSSVEFSFYQNSIVLFQKIVDLGQPLEGQLLSALVDRIASEVKALDEDNSKHAHLALGRLLYLVWAIASNTDRFNTPPYVNQGEPTQSVAGGRQLLARYELYERALSPLLCHQKASPLHQVLALKITHALLDVSHKDAAGLALSQVVLQCLPSDATLRAIAFDLMRFLPTTLKGSEKTIASREKLATSALLQLIMLASHGYGAYQILTASNTAGFVPFLSALTSNQAQFSSSESFVVLVELSVYLVECLLNQASNAFGVSRSESVSESQAASYVAIVTKFVGFEVKDERDSHSLGLLSGLLADREEDGGYREYLQGRIDAILEKFALSTQHSTSFDPPVFEFTSSDITNRPMLLKDGSNATKALFDIDSIFSLKSVFEDEELFSLDPINLFVDSYPLNESFILESKNSNKRARQEKEEASKKEKERLNNKKREFRFTTNTSRTPSLHVDDYVNKEKHHHQQGNKGKPMNNNNNKNR